jgi:hypothetical protein
MEDKIFFTYERMEPFKYPSPRDLRSQLMVIICNMYKDIIIGKIPYSTEIVLKSIKSKDPEQPDKILLKYKIVSFDWEDLRHIKDVKFNKKMFKWLDLIEKNYDD